jgi:hypothetical protein
MDQLTAFLGPSMAVVDFQSTAIVFGIAGAGFDGRWRGYSVDLLGTVVWPPPEPTHHASRRLLRPGRNAPPIPSFEFPFWRIKLSARSDEGLEVDTSIVIQVQRLVLRCEGTLVTLEGRWSEPEGGTQVVVGLERVPTNKVRGDVGRLLRGLPFFGRVVDGGRPRGTGTFQSQEEFLEAVRAAVTDLRNLKPHPTMEDVAAYFTNHSGFPACRDIRQLRRFREDAGFASWKEVMAAVDA